MNTGCLKMARDRFIWFKGEHKVPSKDDVQSVLTHFIGEAGTVEWRKDQSRFYMVLQGDPSWPFTDMDLGVHNPHGEDKGRSRWIEVYMGKDNIDVMTRMMDEYTNTVADGVAKMIARFWQGQLEDDT